MSTTKPVLAIVLSRTVEKIASAINEADIAYHEVYGLGAVDGVFECGQATHANLVAAEGAIRRAAVMRRVELHTPRSIDREQSVHAPRDEPPPCGLPPGPLPHSSRGALSSEHRT
jgi:hypothetical protein